MSIDGPDWGVPSIGPNSLPSSYERRSTIYNDPEIEDGDTPSGVSTDDDFGKYFSRGCMGKIDSISIYCRTTASPNLLNLGISPYPGLGALRTLEVPANAGWEWTEVNLEEYWGYEPLFIWVVDCVNIEWGYDEEQPVDGHETTDYGVTWQRRSIRPFIRVNLSAESPGNVPVTGVVNNIQLPNLSPAQDTFTVLNISADSDAYHRITGAGYTILIGWYTSGLDDYNNIEPRLRLDDNQQIGNFRFDFWYRQYLDSVGSPFWWGKHDTTNDRYMMWLKARIPFRRECAIGFYNRDTVAHSASLFHMVELLT